MDNFKKSFAGASSLFNRAKQFTEEKLGNAEKTTYDTTTETLIHRSEMTKNLTERIITNTTNVLQPNPNERLEDFVLSKLDRKVPKPNNLEILGHCLVEASHEIGNLHPYGNILAKVGETEKKLGNTEKEFVQKCSDCFLQPLKSFLEGQMKTIMKEKKTLEIKRLDLDACKARLKKLNENSSAKLEAEEDVRQAQTEFDRQCELTRLLMDELTVTYNHHLQCLTDFVDAQLNYYNSCTKTLQDLSRQIGGMGITQRQLPPQSPKSPLNSTTGTTNSAAATATTTTTTSDSNSFSALNGTGPAVISSSTATAGLAPSFTNKKTAKVLFDYEATDPSEMSVSANQIITVQIVPNDNDWVLGESGRDSGKVPKAYIQIVN